MEPNAPSENRNRAWLETISNRFQPSLLVKRDLGPMFVRQALGLTADAMGKLVGGYKRQTIYTWERPERGERLPARYAMTDKARQRYRAVLGEAVAEVSRGRVELYAIFGPRRWTACLLGVCRACGHKFVMHRRTAVRCRRCIRKGKR